MSLGSAHAQNDCHPFRCGMPAGMKCLVMIVACLVSPGFVHLVGIGDYPSKPTVGFVGASFVSPALTVRRMCVTCASRFHSCDRQCAGH